MNELLNITETKNNQNDIASVGVETVVRQIEVLNMIAEDMKNDAKEFDGKPFNGRTVAEYFGNQGAAIASLANIVKSILEEKPV